MRNSPFSLLELPGGRWCVAKVAATGAGPTGFDPVGFYASRDDAERAVQRATPAASPPLAPFAAWLRHG